jgi:hypothetical protein
LLDLEPVSVLLLLDYIQKDTIELDTGCYWCN